MILKHICLLLNFFAAWDGKGVKEIFQMRRDFLGTDDVCLCDKDAFEESPSSMNNKVRRVHIYTIQIELVLWQDNKEKAITEWR